MKKVPLKPLVEYCDRILRTGEERDYERAANGLQVENDHSVTRIATTVDASLATIKLAVKALYKETRTMKPTYTLSLLLTAAFALSSICQAR